MGTKDQLQNSNIQLYQVVLLKVPSGKIQMIDDCSSLDVYHTNQFYYSFSS